MGSDYKNNIIIHKFYRKKNNSKYQMAIVEFKNETENYKNKKDSLNYN
jgi:hypothetical protein